MQHQIGGARAAMPCGGARRAAAPCSSAVQPTRQYRADSVRRLPRLVQLESVKRGRPSVGAFLFAAPCLTCCTNLAFLHKADPPRNENARFVQNHAQNPKICTRNGSCENRAILFPQFRWQLKNRHCPKHPQISWQTVQILQFDVKNVPYCAKLQDLYG